MSYWNVVFALFFSASVIGCGGSSEGSSNTSTSTVSSSSSEMSSESESSSSLSSNSVSSTSTTSSSNSLSSQSSENTLQTGRFLDAAVENLDYVTDTQTGSTSGNGEFTYIADDQITFSIGDLVFPTVAAQEILTPKEVLSAEDPMAPEVVNMVRLLLSLDKDSNPENGIYITEDAKSAATPIDFSLSPDSFSTDSAVMNLIANAGQDISPMEIVSEMDAAEHFAETVSSIGASTYYVSGVDIIISHATGAEPRLVGIRGSFVHHEDGTCRLQATEKYADSCTYNADGVINTNYGTLVGTVGNNSVTFIAKPNYTKHQYAETGETITGQIYGKRDGGDFNISPGVYNISGVEQIAEMDGEFPADNKEGPDSYTLNGTFTVYEDDTCRVSHNEGAYNCSLNGSEIFANPGGTVRGTVTDNSVTIIYRSNFSDNEIVYGYLIGTRND